MAPPSTPATGGPAGAPPPASGGALEKLMKQMNSEMQKNTISRQSDLKRAVADPMASILATAFGPVMKVLDAIMKLLGLAIMPFVNLLLPFLIPIIYMLLPIVRFVNMLIQPLITTMMRAMSSPGVVAMMQKSATELGSSNPVTQAQGLIDAMSATGSAMSNVGLALEQANPAVGAVVSGITGLIPVIGPLIQSMENIANAMGIKASIQTGPSASGNAGLPKNFQPNTPPGATPPTTTTPPTPPAISAVDVAVAALAAELMGEGISQTIAYNIANLIEGGTAKPATTTTTTPSSPTAPDALSSLAAELATVGIPGTIAYAIASIVNAKTPPATPSFTAPTPAAPDNTSLLAAKLMNVGFPSSIAYEIATLNQEGLSAEKSVSNIVSSAGNDIMSLFSGAATQNTASQSTTSTNSDLTDAVNALSTILAPLTNGLSINLQMKNSSGNSLGISKLNSSSQTQAVFAGLI